jgi:hypothetical protein
MSQFERSLRRRLDDFERQLDEDTATRLAGVRRRALSMGGARRSLRLALPAAGMAAATLVLALWLLPPENRETGGKTPPLSNNAEFYENLDFYYWLAESERSSNG